MSHRARPPTPALGLLRRVESARWGPRAVDLDILAYDDKVVLHGERASELASWLAGGRRGRRRIRRDPLSEGDERSIHSIFYSCGRPAWPVGARVPSVCSGASDSLPTIAEGACSTVLPEA